MKYHLKEFMVAKNWKFNWFTLYNLHNIFKSSNLLRSYGYTGCEGYWRPIFKMVSCISRLSDHDKIFTVYPPLHLLLSTGVHLPSRLKGPRQENQKADIVKIIRAVWGKMENKKFKKQGIRELQYRV